MSVQSFVGIPGLQLAFAVAFGNWMDAYHTSDGRQLDCVFFCFFILPSAVGLVDFLFLFFSFGLCLPSFVCDALQRPHCFRRSLLFEY